MLRALLPSCLLLCSFALLLPTAWAAPPSEPAAGAPPAQATVVSDTQATRAPALYEVQPGDTLSEIAATFEVEIEALMAANGIEDAAAIRVGESLRIPGSDGTLPEVETAEEAPAATAPPFALVAERERENVRARMTRVARRAAPNSPFYRTTWVTYYGRPGVAIMGILGEYPIAELAERLAAQAAAYDEANGPELGVTPAFHLVYGMATKDAGEDGDYLIFMSDDATQAYVDAAAERGWQVILDIQIGNREPADALSEGFAWLRYPHVHLALDPEFAMSHPDQDRPGLPIGFVTAAQINAAQAAMRDYMRDNQLPGRRVLILHQFLRSMIQDKEQLAQLYKIDLTITADGWGGPMPKISKYNDFTAPEQQFTGFKLFYQWDVPLLNERETLGVALHPDADAQIMRIAPNLIIYQ